MCSRFRQKSFRYNIDPIYQSRILYIFVNHWIRKGQKSLSYRIFFSILYIIQQKINRTSMVLIEQRIRMVCPVFELRSFRVSGAIYQLPIEISTTFGICTAIRWILNSASIRQVKSIIICLSEEIVSSRCGIGGAVQKQEDIYRIVEANKAFSRYQLFSS